MTTWLKLDVTVTVGTTILVRAEDYPDLALVEDVADRVHEEFKEGDRDVEEIIEIAHVDDLEVTPA